MSRSINEVLIALRTNSGLTQEEAASHLGLSKAAVSKWECGQSMPDISLLPAIAELYSVTIDELFDRHVEIEQEVIDATYLELLSLFSTDFGSGMAYVKEQARLNWSCAQMLRMLALASYAQIPSLPGFADKSVEGEALECAQEVERLLTRANAIDPSDSSIQSACAILSRIYLWTDRGEEAVRLIEGYVDEEPNLSAISLAQLHRDMGNPDTAMSVLQRGLLLSLVEAEATIASLAPIASDEQLGQLASLACALQEQNGYISLFPTLMPVVRLEEARRAAHYGSERDAIAALDMFADALDATCHAMREPENPVIFDRVTDMMWSEADEATTAERLDAAKGLRDAYTETLSNDAAFDRLRGMDEYASVMKRISEND